MSSYSRSRYRDKRITKSYNHLGENYTSTSCSASPSWSTFYNSGGTYQIGEYESMTDVVTSRFHARSAKGETIFSPMTKVKCVIDEGSGTDGGQFTDKTVSCPSGPIVYTKHWRFSLTSGSYGRLNSGFTFPILNGFLLAPGSIISDFDRKMLLNEAVTECLSKRGVSDSNLWESVAELNKSLGMASQAADNINKFLSRNPGLLSRAKNAGNLYLLYRYGLSPLISDFQSAFQGIQKAVGLVRKTSRGKASYSTSTTSLSSYLSAYAAYSYKRQIQTSETLTFRAMSLDEMYADLGFNVGFNTKSLITLPWELIPYSFVVDWFVNIGDLINAVAPTFGLRQCGSCLVETRDITETATYTDFLPISTQTISRYPNYGSCSRTWQIKGRTAQLPSPGLAIKSDFRLTNATRLLDAVSLIIQRLR